MVSNCGGQLLGDVVVICGKLCCLGVGSCGGHVWVIVVVMNE